MQDLIGIEIRNASPDDFLTIRQLAEEIWPGTYGKILSATQIEYMIEMMYAIPVLTREVDEAIRFRLLLDGGVPIGFFSWGPYSSQPSEAKLHKLYLKEEYHGRGIGSLALQATQKEAKDAGFSLLRLNVNRNNAAAIRSYRNNGFSVIESLDVPIGNGFFMNDYVMQAVL